MKTKELIRQLQEADPSGELECCVDNADIFAVWPEEAYWDGCLQMLIRDQAKAPYYDVIGAKVTSKGTKVRIRPMNISDAIFNDHTLPIEYDCGEQRKKEKEAYYEKERAESIRISNDVECGFLQQYMEKKHPGISKQKVHDFYYESKMSHDDPMPEDILHHKLPKDKDGLEWTPSWYERRCMQWDREIEVEVDDGVWTLKKRT